MALDPDHAPEAVQLEAFIEDQEIVTAELTEVEEGEEEMVTVGVGVGAGVPPPPHPAARTSESTKTQHPYGRWLSYGMSDVIPNSLSSTIV